MVQNNMVLRDMDLLLEEVREKHYRRLAELLSDWNEADIAEFLEEVSARLGSEKALLLFRILPKETAAEVFSFLPVESRKEIFSGMTDAEMKDIVEDLSVDDAVDTLGELPAAVVRRVLENTSPETRASINRFLNYPENSAGSVMTAEYLALKQDMTVGGAFDYIRTHGQDKETVYNLFVIDAQRHLEGVVTARDLLMHDYAARIGDMMNTNVICAVTTEDREEVTDRIRKYDLMAIPVVDRENRLVGVITVDDAMDVMEAEATEDIQKMAAMLPNEKPYLKTGVFSMWRSRIPWLLLLMVSATFTGQIITHFENSLAACVSLTAFIPMLTDTGGNSGSQASATVIRALSLNELRFRDTFRVIWKELRVALVCGITLAAVSFAKILLVDGMLLHTAGITVGVTAVVSLTLIATVVSAKVIGCLLPIAADRLGIDPAVMASPLITTIVDATSLMIYFGIAGALLPI